MSILDLFCLLNEYANNLPIRISLDSQLTVVTWLNFVSETVWSVYLVQRDKVFQLGNCYK